MSDNTDTHFHIATEPQSHTDTQNTHTQAHRHTDTQTHRHRHTRHTDTQTHRHTDTKSYTDTLTRSQTF